MSRANKARKSTYIDPRTLIIQTRIGQKSKKTSSILLVVSIQYRLVTDGRTDGDSIYRASIASHGKNDMKH